MNNKGFIVSTILYTILVAFLLFLAVTLSVFASATSTVGGGTNDLVNATYFKVWPVKNCEADKSWYEPSNNVLAIITTKYGEYYWPKDFGGSIEDGYIKNMGARPNIKLKCSADEDFDNEYECEDFYIGKYKTESDGYFNLWVEVDGYEEPKIANIGAIVCE